MKETCSPSVRAAIPGKRERNSNMPILNDPNLGIQISEGFLPVNMATAANDSDWVKVTNFQRLFVVLFKGVGANGEDPTLTIEQATSAAGGSSKGLNFTELFVKQAATNLQSTGQFTKLTQSAASTYTQ